MLATIIVSLAQSPNPIVTRISQQEINQCRTPAAVAYNYVTACLNRDKAKILSLSAPFYREILEDPNNYCEFISQFSSPDYQKLYIDSWLPIPAGCEIAVLYVQSEDFSDCGLGMAKKVYINVVPSREVGNTGFQDITRMFNTNVKVLLANIDGNWRAFGFK